MRFWTKVKSLLPVSSRSYHARSDRRDEQLQSLCQEVADLKNLLISMDEKMNARVDDMTGRIIYTGDMSREILSVDKAIDSKQDFRFWGLYGNGSADIQERRKFFRTLPQAAGSARLLQLSLHKLLSDFADFCAQNKIDEWWLIGGTLLGADRHEGFIPWDDDLDVGIMRDSLEKLMKCVADSSIPGSEKFFITIVWDRYVDCKQIRLHSTVPNIPGFIDLFVFDWCPRVDNDVVIANSEKRIHVQHELRRLGETLSELASWKPYGDTPYMPADTPAGRIIEQVFDEALEDLKAQHVICERSEAKAIIRSIDNLDAPRGFHWNLPLEQIFPLEHLTFEGREYPVPRDYEYCNRKSYRDPYELPNDIGQHYEHVSRDVIEDEAVAQAIMKYIQS